MKESGHSGLSRSLEQLFIVTLPSPKGPELHVHHAGGHAGVREGSGISEDVFPALGWVPTGFIEPFSPSSSRLQLGALGLPEVGAPLVRAGLGGSLTVSCRCCLGPAC